MRPVLVAAVLLAAAVPATASADTFDARSPSGAPVVSGTGVAWGARDGRGAHLLYRDATGAIRSLRDGQDAADPDSDGFYGTSQRIEAQSAAGGRIGYTVSTTDSAASKYDGGDGVVDVTAASIAVTGGAVQSVASCGYGMGAPSLGLGDGFTIVGGCAPQAFTPGAVPPVSINGTSVGTGGAVQAAGAFAAWSNGTQVVVRRPADGTQVDAIPSGPAFALRSDGGIAAAQGFVVPSVPTPGGARLELTPFGGTTALAATEEGGIFGLRAGGDAVVYQTNTGVDEQAVVVQRGGQRFEVGRLWVTGQDSPVGFSTDGTRVAFLSARCGGTDLTVTTIGEPSVDRRVAPCPVRIAASGELGRRRLTPAVECDGIIPPLTCQGTATIRAGGRLLARGVFRERESGLNGAPLKLTAVGRRVVAHLGRGRKLRARVQVTRDGGTDHPASSASVVFSR